MIQGLLTDDDLAGLSTLYASQDNRFTALVASAGLDPSQDLRGLNLRRIVVQPGEDLTGYDFTDCDLTGAILRRVDLSGATWTNATLVKTDLRGAKAVSDLLTQAQLKEAKTGPLPPALRQGPNRLWPVDLIEEIEQILSRMQVDDALFFEAQNLLDSGSYKLAEQLFTALLDWRLIILETDAPNTLTARYELARALLDQGLYDRAEDDFADLLAIEKRVMGPEHPNTLNTRFTRAQAQLYQGCAAEAEAAFADLIPTRERVQGEEHPHTLITRGTLAQAQLNQGHAAEADATLSDLLPIQERVQGREHPDTFTTRRLRVQCMFESNQPAEAHRAFDVISEQVPDNPRQRSRHLLLQALYQDSLGDGAAAEVALDQAEAVLGSEFAPEHIARREIAEYRRTRTPGQAGGTTLWMLNPRPDDAD